MQTNKNGTQIKDKRSGEIKQRIVYGNKSWDEMA
jgi:hypothetical protein